MHRGIKTLLILAALPFAAVGAEPATHDHEHATPPPAAQAAPPEKAMQDMRAMHEKMMAAKTPAERQALMAEHMKAMQQGMMSMKRMGDDSCKDAAGMKMRMNMMDMMMQMMMDHQPGSAAAPAAPAAPAKK
jgi:hypothetical protein